MTDYEKAQKKGPSREGPLLNTLNYQKVKIAIQR